MSNKNYPTAPPRGYPVASNQMYPTGYPQPVYQTGYPYQQPYGPPAPGYGGAPQYGAPNPGPPPPYTEFPNQQPASAPPPVMPQGMYPQQQPQTVVAPNLWDSGARFDGIAQPRVPPPPPGVAPNAAQMATMSGHTVVGSQQSASWFSGGRNDGGFTWGGL